MLIFKFLACLSLLTKAPLSQGKPLSQSLIMNLVIFIEGTDLISFSYID
jgi:hypothetical protein